MKLWQNKGVALSRDAAKKRYRKPRLEEYGNLREITQTVKASGPRDGNNQGQVHRTA